MLKHLRSRIVRFVARLLGVQIQLHQHFFKNSMME